MNHACPGRAGFRYKLQFDFVSQDGEEKGREIAEKVTAEKRHGSWGVVFHPFPRIGVSARCTRFNRIRTQCRGKFHRGEEAEMERHWGRVEGGRDRRIETEWIPLRLCLDVAGPPAAFRPDICISTAFANAIASRCRSNLFTRPRIMALRYRARAYMSLINAYLLVLVSHGRRSISVPKDRTGAPFPDLIIARTGSDSLSFPA